MLLVGFAILTVMVSIEKVVNLSAPMPTKVAPAMLQVPGYRVRVLNPESGRLKTEGNRRGRELSHAAPRRFQLAPLTGGSPLTLTLLPVRSRTGTELSETTDERQGLTMVAVGAEVPSFALKDRRLLTLPHPGGKNDELVLGRGPSDPPASLTRLQTCVTPSGVVGVSASTLVGKGEHGGSSPQASAMARRWRRLAGLEQMRYECLAVQLQGEATNQRQLLSGWKALRTVLVQS